MRAPPRGSGARSGGGRSVVLFCAAGLTACTADIFHSTDWPARCEGDSDGCVSKSLSGAGTSGVGGASAASGTSGGVGGSGGVVPPAPPCAARFGNGEDDHFAAVAIDAGGDMFVTGYFSGALDLGMVSLVSAGGVDVLVARIDTSCHVVWAERFGAAGDEHGLAIDVDESGDVLVSGDFTGTVDFGTGPLPSGGAVDAFLVKLEGVSGKSIWSHGFGSIGTDFGRAVAAAPDGRAVFTGDFDLSVDFGGGPLVSAGKDDLYVAELSKDGTPVYSARFGDDSDQVGLGIAANAAGEVVVSGNVRGSIDFGAGALPSAGLNDAFVVKLDDSGKPVWGRVFGDEAEQFGYNVAFDPNGDVLLASYFQGSIDFGGSTLTSDGADTIYVAKLAGASGAHVWSKSFGGAGAHARSVSASASGEVVITGDFSGTIDFGGGKLTSAGLQDIFVATFGPDGKYLSSARFGDATDQQSGFGAFLDKSGTLVVAGDFTGTIDLGSDVGKLTSAGANDGFVARLAL